MRLIAWKSDYAACDRLQMNCRVLEHAATRELSAPESDLSRSGLELCATLRASTGLPVHYYLYRDGGDSAESEAERKCPVCGGEWRIGRLFDRFDFRCDACGLLSNRSVAFRY